MAVCTLGEAGSAGNWALESRKADVLRPGCTSKAASHSRPLPLAAASAFLVSSLVIFIACYVFYVFYIFNNACSYHSAVLTDTGYLYTCGANGCGQLGLEHEKMMFFLTPVKALYGLKIRLVSCGSSFTVAASDNAQIYSWGDNR
jgi:hypothetical protein